MVKVHLKKNAVNAKQKAIFLRRRRLEKGMKLEEVAEGICSVSYLSRIEKNQVEVNEDYYKALFERLELDYDITNQNREYNYIVEILIKYQQGLFDEIHSFVIEMVENKCYLDIEIELILLFDNILRGVFEEAKKTMTLIETYHHGLSNSELAFFMFLVGLYGYKTNQIKKTIQQLEVLERMEIDEEVLKYSIVDLGISTYYLSGNLNKAYLMFLDFKNNASIHFFNRKILLHQIESISYINIKSYDETIKQFEEIKMGIDLTDEELIDSYDYHISMYYYKYNKYQEAISLLLNRKMTPRLTSILTAICLKKPNEYINNEKIQKALNIHFNKYNEIYKEFVDYFKLKMSDTLTYKLWDILKSNLTKGYFYDHFIYTFKIKELMSLGLNCSKHKETLRIINTIFESIDNINFKNGK